MGRLGEGDVLRSASLWTWYSMDPAGTSPSRHSEMALRNWSPISFTHASLSALRVHTATRSPALRRLRIGNEKKWESALV